MNGMPSMAPPLSRASTPNGILALNLNALMRLLVMPKEWATKRLKAIRFGLINVAGRVVKRSRQLFVRLSVSHPFSDLLIDMRGRILALAKLRHSREKCSQK